MLFKNLIKTIALLGAPLAAYAVDSNCANPDKIDSDECKADILIVTTEEKTASQNTGFNSIVQTLDRFSIPANQLTVPQLGMKDEEIYRILYKDDQHTQGRYLAVVFPNGRVSYSNLPEGSDASQNQEALWKSAFTWSQWQIFTQYSAATKSRIVYLNEYPSNNTGTDVANQNYKVNQKISVEQDLLSGELDNVDLNTEGIWHYPARIADEQDLELNYGFSYVRPLLMFEPAGDVTERTVAAVECENQGAEYAGFFTSFGEWSTTAAALNIYWLSWALGMDLEKISKTHITTQDALKKSDAPKTIRLALGCITISTLFVIIASLI